MKKQKAIEELNNIKKYNYTLMPTEALDMAIEALSELSRQGQLDGLISLQALTDAIDKTTWYHQNRNKDMVSGANSAEHQAWFKVDDIYKAIECLSSAQPERNTEFVKLTVRDINGKPYYSIIYLEDGNEIEGYSSYSLDVVSDYLKRYFSSAQTERQKGEWILCSERIPEEGRECWITTETTENVYRGTYTEFYGEGHYIGFICDDGFIWWNTTKAWMYFENPEPYKGENE